MNNEKALEKHSAQMNELRKHFKKLKRITILVWLIVNIVVDVASYLIFQNGHIEIFIFVLIITALLSTLVMINTLNRQDKIRITQETQLMEKTPLNRLKF